MAVLIIRALLFGVYVCFPEFLEPPISVSCRCTSERQPPGSQVF